MEVEMRKNPVPTKAPAEQVVKDIRRAAQSLRSRTVTAGPSRP
jgi:hypothetical protein